METKNNPNPNGCLARALPDEPFLTLLARDLAAPQTIRFWADLRCEMSVEDVKHQDGDQITEALETAEAMEQWRKDNDGRWRTEAPPLPGDQSSPEMSTLAATVLNRTRKMIGDAGEITVNPGDIRWLVESAQSLAGSVLSQDETPGQVNG